MPALWRRCVDVALKGLPADQVPSMFDDVMRAYGKLLKDSDLETDPALAERVATMQRLYVDRRPGLDGHPKVLAPLFEDLRDKLAKNKLGAVARSFAAEVIATVDVEHGTWQGRRVDLPLMDTLAAAGNEMTLTRFAERLPDARPPRAGEAAHRPGPRRAVGLRRGARLRRRRRGGGDPQRPQPRRPRRSPPRARLVRRKPGDDPRRAGPPAGLAAVRHAARLRAGNARRCRCSRSCRFEAACGRSCNRSRIR